MDGQRFDAIVRRVGEARSRRSLLWAALGAALGVTIAPAQDAAARRHACQVRCGADRRICKIECRRTGSFARQCKRDCLVWRKQCFERCQFKPLTRRLAR